MWGFYLKRISLLLLLLFLLFCYVEVLPADTLSGTKEVAVADLNLWMQESIQSKANLQEAVTLSTYRLEQYQILTGKFNFLSIRFQKEFLLSATLRNQNSELKKSLETVSSELTGLSTEFQSILRSRNFWRIVAVSSLVLLAEEEIRLRIKMAQD